VLTLNIGINEVLVAITMDINGTNIRAGYCFEVDNDVAFKKIYEVPTPTFDIQHYESKGHKAQFKSYLLERFIPIVLEGIKLCREISIEELLREILYPTDLRNSIIEQGIDRIPLGISFSGQVSEEGIIYSASSIFKAGDLKGIFNDSKFDKDGLNLKDIIKDKYPRSEVFILNNISAAAWKYSEEEELRKYDKFLILHIASGVGSKVFDNTKKEIIIDKKGICGELGHICCSKEDFLKKYSFECACGSKNHLAAFILPNGLKTLFHYYSEHSEGKFNLKRFLNHREIQINEDDIDDIIERIKKSYHDQSKVGHDVMKYIAKLLAQVISYTILSIGIDKVIIKGSQFKRLDDNITKEFFGSIIISLKEHLNNYFKPDDNFVINRCLDEEEDRKESIIGMFYYINRQILSTCRVSSGYCFQKPAFELSANNSVKYPIIRTDSLFSPKDNLLQKIVGSRRTLIIYDQHYDSNYDKKIPAQLKKYFDNSSNIEIKCINPINPDNSEQKNMESVLKVIDYAWEFKLPRNGLMMAIGGGVTLDIVGFAAQQYMRMVDYVKIPTTLMGQIDAGIAVKVGVNYKDGKNLTGGFYPPLAVINHIPFLYDLPDSHMECGIAEILKMGIIESESIIIGLNGIQKGELTGQNLKLDRGLREKFIKIMDESIEKMLFHLQKNLYEKNSLKREVDFGHTFSPSLESVSGYKVPHGYAVAIDMFISCFIANELRLIKNDIFINYLELMKKFNIITYPEILDTEKERIFGESIIKTVGHRGGNFNMVIPYEEVGKHGFINLDECKNEDGYQKIVELDTLKIYYMRAVEYLQKLKLRGEIKCL
jgi:2-epi-5-epi-valiolone synthase